jgi:hypothetical protein
MLELKWKKVASYEKFEWKSIRYENWNIGQSSGFKSTEGSITEEKLKEIQKIIDKNLHWDGMPGPDHQIFLSFKEYKEDNEMDWVRLTSEMLIKV